MPVDEMIIASLKCLDEIDEHFINQMIAGVKCAADFGKQNDELVEKNARFRKENKELKTQIEELKKENMDLKAQAEKLERTDFYRH